MLGCNPRTEVLYEEFDGMRNGASAENNPPTRRTIFQCIVNEIREDLVDSLTVGAHQGKILGKRVRCRKVLALQMVSRGRLYLQFDAVGASDFAEAFFSVVQ